MLAELFYLTVSVSLLYKLTYNELGFISGHKPQFKEEGGKKAQNYNHSLNSHLTLRVLAPKDFWRRREPLEMSLKGRNKG